MTEKPTQAGEIARLAAIRTRHGRVPEPEYAESLARLGRPITPGSMGHLRKELGRIEPAPKPKALTITTEILVLIARAASLAAFHAAWILPRYPDLTYTTFWRQFRDQVDPWLRAVIRPGRGGMKEFRRRIISCLWSAENFAQIWQADVWTLPFLVIPPVRGAKHGRSAKLIVILDDATRYVVGWKLVCRAAGDVRARDVCDVLIGAMDRYGVPDQFIFDNGKEFDNTQVSKLLTRSLASARFVARYRGERKGKIEKFFELLGRWMTFAYPSWTAGQASSGRYALRGGSTTHAPDFATAHAFVAEMLDNRYNRRHKHSAHGMTPADAVAADPAQPRRLALHKVLHYGSIANEGGESALYKVQGYGLNHNNKKYANLDLDPVTSPGRRPGESGAESLARMRHAKHGVRVREINGDPTRIGVYTHDDKFVCIATDQDYIPTETKLRHSEAMEAKLWEGETIAAQAQAAKEAACPPVDDADGSDEYRDITKVIAETLDTSYAKVVRNDPWPGLNTQQIREYKIDDPTVTIDEAQIITIMTEWARRHDQTTYRLTTPSQIAMFDPATGRVTLGDILDENPVKIYINHLLQPA